MYTSGVSIGYFGVSASAIDEIDGTRDGRRLTGEKPIALPKLLPSEYFHRQILISFVDDPLGVKMVGNVLDADKVMFGSDYPHPASTWPNSQAAIAAQIESLPAATVQKITRDNARGCLALLKPE